MRARLEPTGPALGMLSGLDFGRREVTLASGELLFAFTDGVTEAKGESGFYGEERLLAFIAEAPAAPQPFLAELDARLAAHVGAFERSDDITALAARRT